MYICTCPPPPGVSGLHHVHNVHVNCSPLTFYFNTVTKQPSQPSSNFVCALNHWQDYSRILLSVVMIPHCTPLILVPYCLLWSVLKVYCGPLISSNRTALHATLGAVRAPSSSGGVGSVLRVTPVQALLMCVCVCSLILSH